MRPASPQVSEQQMQEAIGQALEGELDSQSLRQMQDVLRDRLAGLQREAEAAEEEQARVSLLKQTAALRRQVEVLSEEAVISEFVEDSARAVARSHLPDC